MTETSLDTACSSIASRARLDPRRAALRERMQRTGQWSPAQAAGRRWAIGCVSLEITQRCNLDCTLCYLSDSAEALRDVPLEELFRRIDAIAEQFGPNTDVQISGGDPTLRDRTELDAIVRHIRARGLRASLFTNGILLNRTWLVELAQAGLNDVAFHVDMTQQRKGHASELELNEVRRRCIEMARGLPLSVMFNTTAFPGNLHEIDALVDFFIRHSDVVRFASFQLGADTGRGSAPADAAEVVTQANVWQRIERGAGIALNTDALRAGHRGCNRYAMLVSIGSRRFDPFADSALVARVLRATEHVDFQRNQGAGGAWALARAVLKRPGLWGGFARHGGAALWRSRGVWFEQGRPRMPRFAKISFFTHSFMDACALDAQRIDACVFMAATLDGAMSMCAYNAERDRHLLKPIRLRNGEQWQPLALAPDAQGHVHIPLKWLKGKLRQASMGHGRKPHRTPVDASQTS